MQFNVDVWLNDGEYGLRYEDGLVVTDDGIEELTSYRREIIELERPGRLCLKTIVDRRGSR